MAKLLVHESTGVREFEIVDQEVHIGRELDNTLRLPDPSVSRHHCVIRKTPVGFEVQDLQSSNGVLLNGTRVQHSPLRHGDRLTLGQIQLTFQDPQPVEAGATVAVSREELQAMQNPLGTVRMTADQMAAMHASKAAPEPRVEVPTEDIPRPAFPPSMPTSGTAPTPFQTSVPPPVALPPSASHLPDAPPASAVHPEESGSALGRFFKKLFGR